MNVATSIVKNLSFSNVTTVMNHPSPKPSPQQMKRPTNNNAKKGNSFATETKAAMTIQKWYRNRKPVPAPPKELSLWKKICCCSVKPEEPVTQVTIEHILADPNRESVRKPEKTLLQKAKARQKQIDSKKPDGEEKKSFPLESTRKSERIRPDPAHIGIIEIETFVEKTENPQAMQIILPDDEKIKDLNENLMLPGCLIETSKNENIIVDITEHSDLP